MQRVSVLIGLKTKVGSSLLNNALWLRVRLYSRHCSLRFCVKLLKALVIVGKGERLVKNFVSGSLNKAVMLVFGNVDTYLMTLKSFQNEKLIHNNFLSIVLGEER